MVTAESSKQHIRSYPHLYRFVWGNRELPKGALVRLIAVGKLNSCEVELLNESRKHYITDRRGLRIAELFHWGEAGA